MGLGSGEGTLGGTFGGSKTGGALWYVGLDICPLRFLFKDLLRVLMLQKASNARSGLEILFWRV